MRWHLSLGNNTPDSRSLSWVFDIVPWSLVVVCAGLLKLTSLGTVERLTSELSGVLVGTNFGLAFAFSLAPVRGADGWPRVGIAVVRLLVICACLWGGAEALAGLDAGVEQANTAIVVAPLLMAIAYAVGEALSELARALGAR